VTGCAVTVRDAEPGDLPELVALVRAAFADYAGRLAPPSGAHAETEPSLAKRLEGGGLVAAGGGALLGCVFLAVQGRDLYLSRLAVLPAARGLGVARLLLERAFVIGRREGLVGATVGVRLALPENIGFFAALGFRPYDVGTHEGFRHPTFLRMRRSL
jgi:GNAT superfamily N-acetyltransferase